MRRIAAVNICLLLIIFFTAGVMGQTPSDSESIQNLISDRIKILNRYYSMEKDFDATRQALEQIEKDTLLKNDTALMKAYANTDVERIPKHKIKIDTCQWTSYGFFKGTVKISYILQGNDGNSSQAAVYDFTGEKDGDTIKLTSLQPI